MNSVRVVWGFGVTMLTFFAQERIGQGRFSDIGSSYQRDEATAWTFELLIISH